MVEEETENLNEETEQKNKSNLFKWITGILFFLTWIVLIVVANSTEISLKYPVIVSIVLSVVFFIGFFNEKILARFKKQDEKSSDEIPEPIGEQEVRDKVKEIIFKRMNHIKINNGIVSIKPHTINKNLIYEFRLNLLYEEELEGVLTRECFILVNASYPKIIPAILPGNCSRQELAKAINSISNNPKDDPEIEERTETDLSSGKEVKYKKTIPKQKKKRQSKSEDEVI